MPPPPAQKGTGKRAGTQRDVRQSRSRNATPSSVGEGSTVNNTDAESKYLELVISPFPFAKYDDIVDPDGGSAIPDSKSLDAIMERLDRLLSIADARGKVCDRGMRLLSIQRKEQAETERREQERRDREAADEAERGRQVSKLKKKNKDTSRAREERPLAQGAHGVGAQDGTTFEGAPTSSPRIVTDRNPVRPVSRDGDSASSSLSPVEQTTPPTSGVLHTGKSRGTTVDEDDDDSSSDDHQPPPAAAVPHLLTFGDDPWEFPDPTVYEIREVKPGMSEAEIKLIYSVAEYPHDDLHDLIPGTPPDKDFSNAKPTNQVQATTFAAYADSFMRPFTEEDLAFLRDRGDRSNPFVMPRRGKKHYAEVWAEEDGAMPVDTPKQAREKLPANQPRGSIDDMDDAVAETDEVSVGPVLSRVLSLLRPEHRAPPDALLLDSTNVMGNGDISLTGDLGGDITMTGDFNGDIAESSMLALVPPPPPPPPATFMAESSNESWKKVNHPKLDHAQVDERLKQELRFIGFLSEDAEPDYDAHYDDDVAARLRTLQAQLKEQSIINGARKARMMDLVKERMAHQEYTTILEDLDSQVQTAFSKRSRTMGKNKKTKRPGGAGGGSHFVGAGSVARPGIGDLTKTLMDRRKKWIDGIGPVFDKDVGKVPRVAEEGSSIFKDEDMAEYLAREREGWDEDGEEEA